MWDTPLEDISDPQPLPSRVSWKSSLEIPLSLKGLLRIFSSSESSDLERFSAAMPYILSSMHVTTLDLSFRQATIWLK